MLTFYSNLASLQLSCSLLSTANMADQVTELDVAEVVVLEVEDNRE